jgi:putative FmdB family regulatory protein
MPTYTFSCNKCNKTFEIYVTISQYSQLKIVECEHCNSNDTERLVAEDVKTINSSVKKSDSELKTIGDLADRNRDSMTKDHMQTLYNKHNAYKETETPLPEGTKRLKKTKKIKWT